MIVFALKLFNVLWNCIYVFNCHLELYIMLFSGLQQIERALDSLLDRHMYLCFEILPNFWTLHKIRKHAAGWEFYAFFMICCVSLVSTRKEARWSIRFFSLFTVNQEGYVQQTNKQNWTLNSNEDEKPCIATLYIYTNRRPFGRGNNQNVPEQLDLESSFTFEIYSDYACLKVSRETLRTIDSFLEQSRSIQSI